MGAPTRAEDRKRLHWNDSAERHRLTRDAVLGGQRGRLIDAIVTSVEQKGYAATTLADIVALARVSRSKFYEHFAGKEECFLEAMRVAQSVLARRIAEELDQLGTDDARTRIASVVDTFCEVVAAEPGLSRMVIVESLCMDRATVVLRDYAADVCGEIYRECYERARVEDPSLPVLSDALIGMIPDAIVERTRRVIIEEGAAALPAKAPLFLEFVHATLGLTRRD
ncbi:TetR/AcrR family transcriptional regulator [Nocardia takedensis]|uniref:TetR/AcrR family transcriptional regulator n=1 Tax=Nocardia takedensis TaxID=259390 RepID=UPI0002FECC94|nr:TetR/AcrR family transcriptional regulator [Nocardia takedensis]